MSAESELLYQIGCTLGMTNRLLAAELCKLDALCCCLGARAPAGGGAVPPISIIAASPIAYQPASSPAAQAAVAVGMPTVSVQDIPVLSGSPHVLVPADSGRSLLSFKTASQQGLLYDNWGSIQNDNLSWMPPDSNARLVFTRATHGGLVCAQWWVWNLFGSPTTVRVTQTWG